MLLRRGDARRDALRHGRPATTTHLRHVADVIGREAGAPVFAAMNVLMLPNRTLFICDTYVNREPDAPSSSPRSTLLAAEEVRRFGLAPKVALLSHSNFGSDDSPSARKMREARAHPGRSARPDLEVDGEMHGDAALSEAIRRARLPRLALKGEANLLIMPNLDAANISFNLLKMTGGDGDHRRADPARRGEAGAHRDADRRPCGGSST